MADVFREKHSAPALLKSLNPTVRFVAGEQIQVPNVSVDAATAAPPSATAPAAKPAVPGNASPTAKPAAPGAAAPSAKPAAPAKTAAAKAKFILATDGRWIEAEDLQSGETIADDYANLAFVSSADDDDAATALCVSRQHARFPAFAVAATGACPPR